ncbi:MAG: hypothetical protein A2169_15595 [Deltaproteobacteria bacterium RBG_13_47_9]|nr:MAG: hypothetical protein A2169_15595 [Deltaproteobacteria bacterium RBG_13_47_9]
MTKGKPGGGKCVASPVGVCPEPRISGRFDDLIVKCGDRIGLEADAENIPDGTKTTFRIRQYINAVPIATEIAYLKGLKVRGKSWITKKVFKGWSPPTVEFEVSADGAKAASENTYQIYQYNDFGSFTVTIPRIVNKVSKIFKWTGKYDMEFYDGVLIITTKIKLINRQGSQPHSGHAEPPAGPPVNNQKKRTMKHDIESKLSGKWVLHREKCLRGKHCDCKKEPQCCKFPIKIQVEFVETGNHHEVDLYWGSNHLVDASHWGRVKWRANDYAHETGHLLGWYDEYPAGATGGYGDWRTNRPNAIMNTGLQVPQQYYEAFRAEFKRKLAAVQTDEPWKLVSK